MIYFKGKVNSWLKYLFSLHSRSVYCGWSSFLPNV